MWMIIVNDGWLGDLLCSGRYQKIGFREKKVLISPWWVDDINWRASQWRSMCPRNHWKKARNMIFRPPVSRSYEDRLYDHYGKQILELGWICRRNECSIKQMLCVDVVVRFFWLWPRSFISFRLSCDFPVQIGSHVIPLSLKSYSHCGRAFIVRIL